MIKTLHRSVITGLKTVSLKILLAIGLKLNNPSFVARILILNARNINKKPIYSQILLVNEARGGIKDIEAMIQLNGFPYNVKVIPFWASKRIMGYFFGYEVNDYIFADLSLYDNKKYNNFIQKLYLNLKVNQNVIGIVNFNFSYVSQRVPMRVCRDLKLPFITVMKESFKTPGMFAGYEEIYRDIIKIVEPSDVFFQNFSEMDVFNRVLNSDKKIKTTVVGIPRMDLLYDQKNNDIIIQKPVRNILFMMVGRYTGLPCIGDKIMGKDQMKLKGFVGYDYINDLVLQSLALISKQHNDVSVIAKHKGKEDPLVTKKRALQFPSIKFEDGDMNPEIISNSDVVIAFNSTSLAEAAISSKLIISPEIGVDKDLLSEYFFDLSSFAFVPTTIGEFEKILEELIENGRRPQDYYEGSREFLKALTNNTDGASGKRLKKALLSSMEHCE